MSQFHNQDTKQGFTVKLWRGERMCLLGFDLPDPEADLVGFAIECRSPGSAQFFPLRNRLAFSYAQPVEAAVTGARQFSSTDVLAYDLNEPDVLARLEQLGPRLRAIIDDSSNLAPSGESKNGDHLIRPRKRVTGRCPKG